MNNKNYAPVIIPTLNRYNHFKQCLESLEKCTGADKTEVFVGLDYPPSDKYVDGWKTIDLYLQEKEKDNRFKKLVVFRRDHNYGIKGPESNVAVLGRFIRENYDRYIFSEDDNVFSPNYLLYMNTCLETYKEDPDVIAVTGYSYPIDWQMNEGATVQKQNFNASAWGWGWWTAKRDIVSENISSGDMYDRAPEVLKKQKFRTNIFNAFYEYMCASIIPIEFYKKVQSGRLGITDYSTRQYLTVYDKYIVSPLVSKVRTIGYDGSGVYCQNFEEFRKKYVGKGEWAYNFMEQPLDESSEFELVENDPQFLPENLKLLDEFQWRPMMRHIVANCIAMGIRVFGLKFMRMITTQVFKVWHRRVN